MKFINFFCRDLSNVMPNENIPSDSLIRLPENEALASTEEHTQHEDSSSSREVPSPEEKISSTELAAAIVAGMRLCGHCTRLGDPETNMTVCGKCATYYHTACSYDDTKDLFDDCAQHYLQV